MHNIEDPKLIIYLVNRCHRVFVNELFYENFNIHFYENYKKKLSKKSFTLFIFHKKISKSILYTNALSIR